MRVDKYKGYHLIRIMFEVLPLRMQDEIRAKNFDKNLTCTLFQKYLTSNGVSPDAAVFMLDVIRDNDMSLIECRKEIAHLDMKVKRFICNRLKIYDLI